MTNFTRSYFPTGSRLSTTWGRAVPIRLGPSARNAAAEQNGVTLTEVQAEKWLEKNERWFKEMLTEYGNEVLASASKESFEEVCKV